MKSVAPIKKITLGQFEKLAPVLIARNQSQRNFCFSKINAALLFLGIIRSLVSPSLPGNISKPSRKGMHQSGLLHKLLSLIMGAGIPEVILLSFSNYYFFF